MNHHPYTEYDWYISESVRPESNPVAPRPLRLGPFTDEKECRDLLQTLKQVPRFGQGDLEIHKRRHGQMRVRVAMPVYWSRPLGAEKPRLVHTIDISNSGARLAGLDEHLVPGEVLEIHCGRRRAPFQVVWIGSPGSPTAGQAGVECLTPEANIWDLDLTEAQDESLVQEVAVARAVQSGLLPQEKPLLKTLDYAGACIQARTVGGDYYDFFEMGRDEVGFVLADVAGKGISAALLMANLQGCLFNEHGIGSGDLPRLLSCVNLHFHRHTEAYRYATVFFGCYSDSTRRLHYVNCGHNPPLLLHLDNSVERLNPTATVLGLFPQWECSVAEITLEPGSVLAMYTDGITEARDGNQEEFGQARFLQSLRETRHLNATSMVDSVLQAVERFRVGEQEDDLTLVIARAV
ncbi:MAG: SpoIIE family protein phosphatase [Acidobacteriia bacterium]|nr:SpoIIE family protein phosphatase [Terriglobia bacterium]